MLMVSPPVSTSSPLRVIGSTVEETSDKTTEEEEEEVKEKEMNVDESSINSAVINELFDGVLQQSDDEEEEEEDALNISSMSLLTPLAETVAAVVKSPERRLMVGTNTMSYCEEEEQFKHINISSSCLCADVDSSRLLPGEAQHSRHCFQTLKVPESQHEADLLRQRGGPGRGPQAALQVLDPSGFTWMD